MPTPDSPNKIKKRGFVMTGGGAKGLYEAGVIHAFHITGMEFDIITGSSIGAMNSIFFAEYLLRKHQLSEEIRQNPESSSDAMDDLVKAFHHAWLMMPDKKIIDDSEAGPIGRLKNDLLRFDLSLPQITSLLWWWTDPDRKAVPSPLVWSSVVKLFRELVERLGGASQVLQLARSEEPSKVKAALRTYLRKFDLEHSLIPAGEGDNVLREVFTGKVSALRPEHLDGALWTEVDDQAIQYQLVDPQRTMRDYAQAGIDVRLTRANFRTGRLEISTYMQPDDFILYMDKQAWRVEAADPHTIPLGSFRLQMPGNPNAINAALASGRFPGVFTPYPITDIYSADDPENALLYRMLENWLDDPQAEASLAQSYQALTSGESPFSRSKHSSWESLITRWKKSSNMRLLFPRKSDSYVDGGAIDNTPANSAIDTAREWLAQAGISKRDALLELFVIFLHAEPRVDPVEVEDPSLFDVVSRTLEIQGAARLSSEAVTVDTINSFGNRGEALGRTLQIVLESYRQTIKDLSPADRQVIEANIIERAREMKQRGYIGKETEGILDRMEQWTSNAIDSLPLHVETVKIYPGEMPLSTLQFTDRLGYRQENALNMLTMGCYNTLWSLRNHLEQPGNLVDELDHQVLAMTRRWMGDQVWPKDYDERQVLEEQWRCQRTQCVFHAVHCPHGARQGSQP